MPYATDSDLTTRIPATLTATLDQRTLALADAAEQIDLDSYLGKAVRAHAFLAAHYLAISGAIAGGGESGLVQSHAMGAISASYAVTALSAEDSLLGTTIYGRQFLQIRSTLSSWPEVG